MGSLDVVGNKDALWKQGRQLPDLNLARDPVAADPREPASGQAIAECTVPFRSHQLQRDRVERWKSHAATIKLLKKVSGFCKGEQGKCRGCDIQLGMLGD